MVMEANKEREKKILNGTNYSLPSPSHCDDKGNIEKDASSEVSDAAELCCICFDQPCTIEVQDCGHQMCAPCTLVLCCHSKPPDAALACLPLCLCWGSISRLLMARTSTAASDPEKTASPQLARRRPLRSAMACELCRSISSPSPCSGDLGPPVSISVSVRLTVRPTGHRPSHFCYEYCW